MQTNPGDQIETEQDALAKGQSRVQIWLKKINLAKKDEEDWRKEAKKAIEIYEADDDKTSFNILHSNIETLVPALYNSTPVPDVRRRYGDADPVAKLVVDMTERALSYSVDQYDFDAMMLAAIKDACVPGRGQARVRYEPEMGQQPDPMTGEMVEVKVSDKTMTERVPWDKFIRGPGRSWSEVPFVAFEHDLTRDELVQLNPEIGAAIAVGMEKNKDEDKDHGSDKGVMATACVYEIWDKATKSVIFISDKEKDRVIKEEPDPLGLEEFFPCPTPIEQVKRVSSLIPVCPYTVYRPLIEELDVITKRIRRLVTQLKVRGLIDSALAAEMDSLRSAEDGQYITATDAATYLTTGGGLEKGIAHMPMDPTVKALQQLYVQREQIKQTIYEVTGLSDILRGASDKTETATAQNLKSQWGSLRIQQLQASIARFARDLFRLKVEIMSKHFDPNVLSEMTNLPDQSKQDQVQAWPQAVQMFKSNTRSFRIDIETDSTIRADMQRSQEQMNLFLAGTGQFAQAMTGVVQLAPEMLPVITEVYTAFARKFKLGKQAEDALDGLSQMAPQMAENAAKQKPPDPAELKAKELEMTMQADQAKAKQTMEIEGQKAQAAAAAKQAEQAANMAMKEREAALMERTRAAELAHAQQMQNLELGAKQAALEMEHEFKTKEREAATEERALVAQDKRRQSSEDHEMKRSAAETDFEFKRKEYEAKQRESTAKPKATNDNGAAELEKRVAEVERRKQITVKRDGDGKIIAAVVE